MLKPPDLIGHVSLSINVGSVTSAKDNIPTRPIATFHRVRDGKARESHEVSMILPVHNEVSNSAHEICLGFLPINVFYSVVWLKYNV